MVNYCVVSVWSIIVLFQCDGQEKLPDLPSQRVAIQSPSLAKSADPSVATTVLFWRSPRGKLMCRLTSMHKCTHTHIHTPTVLAIA